MFNLLRKWCIIVAYCVQLSVYNMPNCCACFSLRLYYRNVPIASEIKGHDSEDEYTPIYKVCYYDNSDIAGALVLAGADQTITN